MATFSRNDPHRLMGSSLSCQQCRSDRDDELLISPMIIEIIIFLSSRINVSKAIFFLVIVILITLLKS